MLNSSVIVDCPSRARTPSTILLHGKYACPLLTAAALKTSMMAAPRRAGSFGALPSRDAKASTRWNVAPRTAPNASNGLSRIKSSVMGPYCAAARCASANGTPCFSKNTAASRLPRDSSQFVFNLIAVFGPIPSHAHNFFAASGEFKTSIKSTPK